MSRYVIEQILKAKKITDYLNTKNIYPESQTGNKIKYRCPIHEGDNDPSFMVYTDGEFENFFCYGCKAKYHIIHLYAQLEKVDFAAAVKALSEGVDINIDAEIHHIIREIENDSSAWSVFSPVQLSLIISRMLYDFLNRVNAAPQYVEMTDKVLSTVDKAVEIGDMEGLKKIHDQLPSALLKTLRDYNAKKQQERKALHVPRTPQ
jgi:hypothetical protein